MSKHTAGPWRALRARIGGQIRVDEFVVKSGTHPNVSTVIASDIDTQANARLIAAAPELLKALKLAVKQNQHDMLLTGEELRQCEAAIAKARSEK